MDMLYNLFFSIQYSDPAMLAYRVLAFLITGALLLYGCVRLALLLNRKSKLHRDHRLLLAFPTGLLFFLPLFAVYCFFLIKENGLHTFHWELPMCYLGILPQLLLWLVTVLLFFTASTRYLKTLKNDTPWQNQPS